MSFVKLSIFGTSFEVGFLLLSFISLTRSQVTTRYVDLQPVGMGAFGLVWYVDQSSFPPHTTMPFQFRKGSAHRRIRCYQEDHETLQHPSPLETHLSRAKTSQAHPTRKRPSPLTSALSSPLTDSLSPDHQPQRRFHLTLGGYVGLSCSPYSPLPMPSPHRPLLSAIS
jgi:hypothetical protein